MLQLGFLGFASPWILLTLLSLPLLWYLLRVTPPAPRRQVFPAVRLLTGLRSAEETPARTPWWLLLLRLVIAACIILALARPILHPAAPWHGGGPMILVIDDGWASARDWQGRKEAALILLEQAERFERDVYLTTTAPRAEPASGLEVRPVPAAQVRRQLEELAPKPWPTDLESLTERLKDVNFASAAKVFWLSDGLKSGGEKRFVEELRRLGPVTQLRADKEDLPKLLLPPRGSGSELLLAARRVAAENAEAITVRAMDAEGYEVAALELDFEAGRDQAEAPLALPLELRNRIERLRIDQDRGVAAILLLDERWRRRPVGLAVGSAAESTQPLLDELYYIERALEPFAEIYRDRLEGLIERNPAVIILTDSVLPSPAEERALSAWINSGGLLLRFAGPRLLEADTGTLLPIPLRQGSRALGGTLAWGHPTGLDEFPEKGPLAGLPVPDDVQVQQQVLAEPTLDLAEKIWARLEDGSPLVTGAREGEGWIVLIHTSANAEWSNLVLSGLFIEILQRLVSLSEGTPDKGDQVLPPLAVLDGFGRLISPPSSVKPLRTRGTAEDPVGPQHPPGFYGDAEARRSLNLSPTVQDLEPLSESIPGVTMASYRLEKEESLLPWLLALAFALSLVDQVLGLALRGFLPRRIRPDAVPRRGGPAIFLLLLALQLPFSGTGRAQADDLSDAGDEFALQVLGETRLGYLLTGNSQQDEISRMGLAGLSQMLNRRTTVGPGEPVGLRPGQDELAFFPLIYWPVLAEQSALGEDARDAINNYLNHGGTLIIDLLRPDLIEGFSNGVSERLREVTAGLELPPLQQVPPDHVLTKTFYLLEEFPGRYTSGNLWIEETDERRHDGVATVILGANDWASAWAMDERGRPLAAVVPGGERQRETAYRFGINLVMYTLTGSYKADQVHVPFILERLGH